MNNLENTNLNETVATVNGANKYNLVKIDTESIKNKVLMNNTFHAFKKAGNCRVCLSLAEFGAIFVGSIFVAVIFSNFLPSIMSNIIFIALFIYGVIFLRNKNSRVAYERYLESQMIAIYKNDLVIMNHVPENVDYKTIQMVEVSGDSYENAKYNLIRASFYLGADGVMNITHSTTSAVSSTKTERKETLFGFGQPKYETVTTGVAINVYMQGMAIKLV
ncbi:hypothetical protein H0A43_03265 [Arcobacter lanthieri]|uniref:hypothetical protein n=1 Tax=Aliarcobacter lanthieri TaxID=1355374 RepID=UPI001924E2A6|nr:hypothetical protein [Aliarcobacter lanthieri]MBL3519476.1 hypothetical protein [Aliarcobacter lanthieri]